MISSCHLDLNKDEEDKTLRGLVALAKDVPLCTAQELVPYL